MARNERTLTIPGAELDLLCDTYSTILVVVRGEPRKAHLALLSKEFDDPIEYNDYVTYCIRDEKGFGGNEDQDEAWARYLRQNASMYMSAYNPTSGGDDPVFKLVRDSDSTISVESDSGDFMSDVQSITDNHANWNGRRVFWKEEEKTAIDVLAVLTWEGELLRVAPALSLAQLGGKLRVDGESQDTCGNIDASID